MGYLFLYGMGQQSVYPTFPIYFIVAGKLLELLLVLVDRVPRHRRDTPIETDWRLTWVIHGI
jgi:hypothetical protein